MYNVLYTKYSTERAREFRIKTMIVKCDDVIYVTKIPMTSEASNHIDNIYNIYNALSKQYTEENIKINKCKKENGNIDFEYVRGKTLEKILDEYLNKNDTDAIINMIFEYKKRLIGSVEHKEFEISDAFKKVFGNVETMLKLDAISVADIDMIFENIIVNENEWTLLDYEWTFLFDVPVNYIIYRALNNYLYKSNKRDMLWQLDLMRQFGISEEEKNIYESMDRNFMKYVKGDNCSMQQLSGLISNPKYDIKDIISTDIPGKVQVFYDYGNSFEEETSEFVNCSRTDDNYYLLRIDVPEAAKAVRIDPYASCAVALIKNYAAYDAEGKKVEAPLIHNAVTVGGDIQIFKHDDPQWVFQNVDLKKIKKIEISFDISSLNENFAEKFTEQMENINEMVNLIDAKNATIENIYNSTSWKITKPIRGIKNIVTKSGKI